jgi:hypothetical protein
MVELIEIFGALGIPVVGAAVLTEAVLARIERRSACETDLGPSS